MVFDQLIFTSCQSFVCVRGTGTVLVWMAILLIQIKHHSHKVEEISDHYGTVKCGILEEWFSIQEHN